MGLYLDRFQSQLMRFPTYEMADSKIQILLLKEFVIGSLLSAINSGFSYSTLQPSELGVLYYRGSHSKLQNFKISNKYPGHFGQFYFTTVRMCTHVYTLSKKIQCTVPNIGFWDILNFSM